MIETPLAPSDDRPDEGASELPAHPSSPLAPPPALSERATAASEASRTMFRYANRWFMVPVHRAGLSAWLGSPLTGCQLLLTTTGRRSGQRRSTPLGYLVADGAAWVLAGYGPNTLWYRNLLADPSVEVLLPGRPAFRARADEVLDPAVRARIIPPLVRSMGIPGSAVGTNVLAATDERILELVDWVPLVRLAPAGPPLVAGPDDPGGLGWVWRQALAIGLTVLAVRGLWRVLRR
jgi:deazaflavin-dependent oxidoreductase (nitroreductase family)